MSELRKNNDKNLSEELEEIKLQNQALKIIFEDIAECIVMVDSCGYIMMMNEPYANFLGMKPEEAIGKHVADVIDNTRLPVAVKTGQAEIGEIQKIQGHYAVTSRIPILKNNEIVGAIGKVIFKDISEVKALYEKLKITKMELNKYKERLRRMKDHCFTLDNIIGKNIKMQELKNTVAKVANTNSTVLITGESGTGKEIFANAIHQLSDRRDNSFVKINCAAIPENILESELFGYEEGAFTGSRKGGKKGKFEVADRGTIFLDEIGDMSFHMQSKILRVLQEQEIERIGGNAVKKIDVRIIAATNQNLQKKIKKGEFREDLFYRLNVVPIKLPPLRERVDDIPLLCDFFIKKYNDKFGIYIEKIEEEAMYYLTKYSWPGNIRQIENVIERAYNFVDGRVIQVKHLPEEILYNSKNKISSSGSLNKILDTIEKRIIIQTLKTYNGNKTKTANVLGISRASLYQKIKKHNIICDMFESL